MATLSFQGQGVVLTGSVSINPANIGAGAVGETTVTIAGVAAGDIVILQPPTAGLTAGLVVCDARASAANEVKVRIFNSTGGGVDEGAATWFYMVFRA